jgi:hypothetical protein
MASGAVCHSYRFRILAAATGEAVRDSGQDDWQRVSLGGGRSRTCDDSVSSGDRRNYRGSILKMKRKAIGVAVGAILLLLAGVYLWRPSAVPPGQEPLTVLSAENLGEFVAAFDADPDVPRIVLLLSPT